jgi:hypothetical protein
MSRPGTTRRVLAFGGDMHDKTIRPAVADGLEPLYSVADLQAWSGESDSVWRKRISRGEIRTVKLGANTRITKSAIDEYLSRREAKS